jgi:hypothetical protein
LTGRDEVANDLLDSFDFTRPPRPPLLLSPRACPASTYLSTRMLTFPRQLVGTDSAAQTVKVENLGSAPLSISDIVASGDYRITENNCPSSLPVSATCTISVSFAPQVGGSDTGTLAVTDDSIGSPHLVNLAGTSTVVTLSPTSFAFGDQTIGTSSVPTVVTLKNNGTGPLTIIGIATTRTKAFTQTNTCITGKNTNGTVGPGESCNIKVSFNPQFPGNVASTLNINDSDGASPQVVSLSGTGVGPEATLSPGSLNLGQQNLGTNSTPQIVKLSNTGNSTMHISGIATTGDFVETNTCIPAGSASGAIAPGASCSISVTFRPSAIGTRTGAVTITDNAGSGLQKVGLTGSGL